MAKGGDNKGGLYENWLKHFTINVMTQSFHAFFLLFVLRMMVEIDKLDTVKSAKELVANDGILAIMSIASMMAIIKFEKLFKDLFGIKDSMAGNLKTSGAEMLLGMQNANALKGELVKPFQTSKDSRKKLATAGKELGFTKYGTEKDSKGRIGNYINTGVSVAGGAAAGAAGGAAAGNAPLSDKTKELYEKMKEAKKNGNMDLYKDYRDHAVTQMKNEKLASSGAGVSGGAGGGGIRMPGSGGDTQSQAQKEAAYNDLVLENRSNNRKKWMKTAGTLASMTVGLGATDNIGQALTAANLINDPINAMTSRAIDHGENINARKATGDSNKYDERTLGTAIKEGFADVTKNMRYEKGSSREGNINPVKLTVDMAKTYASFPLTAVQNVVSTQKGGIVNESRVGNVSATRTGSTNPPRVHNVDDL